MSYSSNFVSSVAKITWEIENFENLNSECKIKSFLMPTNPKIKFQLSCFPCKEFPGFRNSFTCIYLFLENCDRTQATFCYRTSILNQNKDNWNTQEGKVTYVPGQLHHGAFFQIYRQQLLEPANELLIDGKLKIYCEVEDVTDGNCEFPEQIQTHIPPNKLAEDYQSLLESGKFSDASLVVGGKQFLVHKAILSARSKVFGAMFENDCEEKRQNRVEIIDISVEVCEQMLSYIYTGKIPDEMSEYALDLFMAADKYQLEHLKEICEQYLSSNIEVEIAANIFLVADMHNATFLKTKCVDYIIQHGKDVIVSKGWKALIKARPELGFELFQRMLDK